MGGGAARGQPSAFAVGGNQNTGGDPSTTASAVEGADSYYNFRLADQHGTTNTAAYQEHVGGLRSVSSAPVEGGAAVLDVPTQRLYAMTRMLRLLQVILLIVAIPLLTQTTGWRSFAPLQYFLAVIVISLAGIVILTLLEIKPRLPRSSPHIQLFGDLVLFALLLSGATAAATIIHNRTQLSLPCAQDGYANCKRAGGATGLVFFVLVMCVISLWLHEKIWRKQHAHSSALQALASFIRGTDDCSVNVYSAPGSTPAGGVNGCISETAAGSPRITRISAIAAGNQGEVREAPWLAAFMIVFRILQIACSCVVLACVLTIGNYGRITSYRFAEIVSALILAGATLLLLAQAFRLWLNKRKAYGRTTNKLFLIVSAIFDTAMCIVVFASASSLAAVATLPRIVHLSLPFSSVPVDRIGAGAYEDAAVVMSFLSFLAFCASFLVSITILRDWIVVDRLLASNSEQHVNNVVA